MSEFSWAVSAIRISHQKSKLFFALKHAVFFSQECTTDHIEKSKKNSFTNWWRWNLIVFNYRVFPNKRTSINAWQTVKFISSMPWKLEYFKNTFCDTLQETICYKYQSSDEFQFRKVFFHSRNLISEKAVRTIPLPFYKCANVHEFTHFTVCLLRHKRLEN